MYDVDHSSDFDLTKAHYMLSLWVNDMVSIVHILEDVLPHYNGTTLYKIQQQL